MITGSCDEAKIRHVAKGHISYLSEPEPLSLETTKEVTFTYKRIAETAEAEGSTSFLAYSLSKE